MMFTNLLHQGIFFCHIFFFLFVSISLFIILKVLHGLSYPWDATSMTIDNSNVKFFERFSYHSITWHEANEFCQTLDAQLVEIERRGENAAITRAITDGGHSAMEVLLEA